ncbi:MAG: trigger factor [Sulfurovum sp.]|nr:trigger factor [Sulfurovum sp.]
MNISIEKVDDINVILSGTVEHGVTEAKVQELKDIVKAEAALDEDVIGKDDEVYQREAEGEILKSFIEAGLKEANIDVADILGQPGFRKYETRDNGIYLEVEVATNPIINTDVEYLDSVPSFTRPLATKAEVEAKLNDIAIQQATFIPIDAPRAVENFDVAVIDFEGFLDGVAFEGGKSEKFNLKIGSNSFIPGFEDDVIGMQYGEEKTIKVTFPEGYESDNLAGKETEFKVKLHEIQKQQSSELNDALAQRVLNDTSATLDTLKDKLGEKINSQSLSNLYNETLKPQLIKALLPKFDFTLPSNVVEQEIDAKVNEKAQRMSSEDHAKYKDDKEKFHELRDSVRQEAKDSIKIALIVDALAEKEGIVIDEQEVLSALYYQAMMSGQDAQELVQYYKDNNLMTSATMGLKEDKLFGQMLGFDK